MMLPARRPTVPPAPPPAPDFLAPVLVGVSSHFQSGSVVGNYQLALPAGSVAGDLWVCSNPRLTTVAPVMPEGCTEVLAIPRISEVVGLNWNWGVWSKILTSGDISAGYIVIPFISNVTAVGCLVFRNAAHPVTHTPGDHLRVTPATSIAFRQESRASDAPAPIALALTTRNGGLRTTTWPAGWTPRLDVMDPATIANGRISVHACTRGVANESPADTISFSGPEAMCIATMTMIIEGVAA